MTMALTYSLEAFLLTTFSFFLVLTFLCSSVAVRMCMMCVTATC